MRKLRIIILVHPNLIPPEKVNNIEIEKMPWRTEYYIIHALKKMGHAILVLEVGNDLKVIRDARENFKPHIAFNLLESFDGETLFDHNVVSYLELIKLPYTGCNPKGLILSRDKSLCKKILYYHRIKTPRFAVALRGKSFKRLKDLKFPLIVKSLTEEGSVGISQNSIVFDDQKLDQRIKFIHTNTLSDALVETYIEGTDIYVGLIGNKKIKSFPLLELKFKNAPSGIHTIATSKVKWDPDYRKKYQINTYEAKGLSLQFSKKIIATCKRIYRILNISGYVRFDLRLTSEGQIYFIESNPNPDIAKTDDFAIAAKKGGIDYNTLLNKILNLGMDYEPDSFRFYTSE